jgi:hypothetical protein
VRDEQLRAQVARVHQVNYGVYGARKVWLQLNRENIPIAHCTVRRLMREQGLAGAHRGKRKRTTVADPQALRVQDVVNRRFDPAAPNTLWVADFIYVSTWSCWVYVAFVIDAYSRRIVGWRTATSMNTQLVLDAIEHAIWTRAREGVTDLSGLIDPTTLLATSRTSGRRYSGWDFASSLTSSWGRWISSTRPPRCRTRTTLSVPRAKTHASPPCPRMSSGFAPSFERTPTMSAGYGRFTSIVCTPSLRGAGRRSALTASHELHARDVYCHRTIYRRVRSTVGTVALPIARAPADHGVRSGQVDRLAI